MKKLIYLFLVVPSILFCQKIEKIQIKGEKEFGKREVLIYTPIEYYDNSRMFEVIYVFDAQYREFFDVVHSTIAFQNHGIRPMIVVGICSENRNFDFLPKSENKSTIKEQFGQLGGADLFLNFIDKTVIPFIENKYRTIPNRIGIGYSNGATFINYAMLLNPNLFDVIFSIDANFKFDNGILINLLEDSEISLSDKFVYYTCQTPVSNNWIDYSNKFNKLLDSKSSFKIISERFNNESHSSVYQQAVINALKEYYKYQFFDSKNLITYLKTLEENKSYNLSLSELHGIASIFKNFNMVKDAKNILLAFQEKLNLPINGYDIYSLFETADLYFSIGLLDKARKYFEYCNKVLDEKKKKYVKHYGQEFYNIGKEKVREKINHIDQIKVE